MRQLTMRNLLAAALAFAGAFLSGATARAANCAVVVGCNKYDKSYIPSSNWLNGCVPDATHVQELITTRGEWDAANVTKLTDSSAKHSAVLSAIAAAASTAVPGDTFLYFHSSHGGNYTYSFVTNKDLYADWPIMVYGVDPDGEYNCICTYDADFTAAELAGALAAFDPAVKVVVMIDACHSAGMFQYDGTPVSQRAVRRNAAGKAMRSAPPSLFAKAVRGQIGAIRRARGIRAASNVAFVTAANFDEYSYDSGTGDGGTFTTAFIDGVSSGLCDGADYGDGDGWATFYEGWNFAKDIATGLPAGTVTDDGVVDAHGYAIYDNSYYATYYGEPAYYYDYYFTHPQIDNEALLRTIRVGYAGDSPPAAPVPVDASLGSVEARQRYPWNGLVDIDYEVACSNANANVWVEVSVRDTRTGAVMPAWRLSGDGAEGPVKPGAHRMVWDMGADRGREFAADALSVEMAAHGGEAVYLAVDMGGGAAASNWPVVRLPGVPAGGWADEYKTDKLLLRWIAPGSFTMGSPADEPGRDSDETKREVTLTQGFWMGVFEVTQRQWELAMGNNPAELEGTTRPVETVSYDMVRGSGAGAGWPTSAEVDGGSFVGVLRAKTGLAFDLPTEAQWEYACRAGSFAALNSDKGITAKQAACPATAEVARYRFNSGFSGGSDGVGGIHRGHAPVGSYLPNAWGLYDMHGNVAEWCLDWDGGAFTADSASDPDGAASGTNRVWRGGHWASFPRHVRSADRGLRTPDCAEVGLGLRLVMSGEDAETGTGKGCSSAPFRADARAEEGAVLSPSETEWATWDTAWDGAASAEVTLERPSGNVEILGHSSGRGSAEWSAGDEYGAFKLACVSRDASGAEVGRMEAAYRRGVPDSAWSYELRNGTVTVTGGPGNGRIAVPAMLDGYPVTAIAAGAFSGCGGLLSVALPASVTSVGDGAFNGCSGLETLDVPASWEGTSMLADAGIPEGCAVEYERGNTSGDESAWQYEVADGKATVTGGPTSGDLVVPETLGGFPVVAIGAGAFFGCDGITSVIIPDSVEFIDYNAFCDCSGIQSVWIGAGATDLATGYPSFVFRGCSSLTQFRVADGNPEYADVDGVLFSKDGTALECFPGGRTGSYSVPSGTVWIDESAFADCGGLVSVSIPDSVTSISFGTFSSCTSLALVEIGAGVEGMESDAFSGCGSLVDFRVAAGNPVYADVDGVLYSKDLKTLVQYPCGRAGAYAILDGVTDIESEAFAGCEGLTNVVIPSGVTAIEDWAFGGCSSLASVLIPDGVAEIGNEAFWGCESLASVSIPDSVVRMGGNPFMLCDAGLFDGTSIPGVELVDGWAVGNDGSLAGHLDLSGIRGIADGTFWGCGGLESVAVPEGVQVLGCEVFAECTGLGSVTLPAGIGEIGTRAFAGCPNLASVSIPDSVASVGMDAFLGVPCVANVQGVLMLDGWAVGNDGTLAGQLDLSGVRGIAEGAFWACESLTGVVLPEGLAAVPGMAFQECAGLVEVGIPAGVESIGWQAFSGCGALMAMALPDSVRSIGGWAFNSCTGLTSVTIGCNVREIGKGAFWGCSGLTELELPASVERIGKWAFEACENLAVLRVPASWEGTDMLRDATVPTGCEVVYYDDAVARPANDDYADAEDLGKTAAGAVAGSNAGATWEVGEPKIYGSYYRTNSVWWTWTAPATGVARFDTVGSEFDTVMTVFTNGTPGDIATLKAVKSDDNGGGNGTSRVWFNTVAERTYWIAVAGRTAQDSGAIALNWQQCVKVAFKGNGATAGSMGTLTNAYNTATALPACGFEKEGYVCDGWATSASGTVAYALDAAPAFTKNTTLYAHWIAATQTVWFDANGGTCKVLSRTAVVGDVYTKLASAARDGYKFAGWYDAPEGGNRVKIGDPVPPQTERTLFAHWEGLPQTVWFDANGGTCKVLSRTAVVGDVYTKLASATRDGYKFAGWYDAPEGGNRVKIGDPVPPQTERTLFAHWEGLPQTVRFDANGGTCKTSSRTAVVGETYTKLASATRDGYKFAGWYDAPEGGNRVKIGDPVPPQTERTLFAHWEALSQTVWFDANGGKCKKESVTCRFGETYSGFTTATWAGHSFQGWYDDPEGGKRVKNGMAVTGGAERILYAHWKEAAAVLSITGFSRSPRPVSSARDAQASATEYTLRAETSAGVSYEIQWTPALDGGWTVVKRWTAPAEGETAVPVVLPADSPAGFFRLVETDTE